MTEIEEHLQSHLEGVAAIKAHMEAARQKHMNITRDHKDWLASMERSGHHHYNVWDEDEHPGCMIAGKLYMNRAPGRFFIQADGGKAGRNLDPRMTNLSHEIHHLSFRSVRKGDDGEDEIVPDNFEEAIRPFDGNVYVTSEYQQAYSHYIKLVSTSSQDYQVVQNSQLSFYDDDMVPEAKFILDISPIAVRYRLEWRRWYDYVTSLLAIIGGTFTVIGMLDAVTNINLKQILKRKQTTSDQRRAESEQTFKGR